MSGHLEGTLETATPLWFRQPKAGQPQKGLGHRDNLDMGEMSWISQVCGWFFYTDVRFFFLGGYKCYES